MASKRPKGVLIPVGGGEDKEKSKDVLCRIIAETGKTNPNICLITIATDLPEKVAKIYQKAFEDLNISSLSILHFNSRKEADSKENLEFIDDCDLVLLSGGKQLKISTLMGGTKLLERIMERYTNETKFVVAGTSAGAAAMSNTMIISGSSREALIKGTLELTSGLSLINEVTIDTHFTERGRIGRLIQTVACNPGLIGLGLGEDTSVIIKNHVMEVNGSGLVIIVDGHEITFTDLSEIKNGDLMTLDGLKVHVLGHGKRFHITERKIEVPPNT